MLSWLLVFTSLRGCKRASPCLHQRNSRQCRWSSGGESEAQSALQHFRARSGAADGPRPGWVSLREPSRASAAEALRAVAEGALKLSPQGLEAYETNIRLR